MDIELKSLNWKAAADERADALVVLVPDGFAAGSDPLGRLVTQALSTKDFESKAGKLLPLYGAPRVQARRVLLVGVGDGTGKSVRSAVLAAFSALKGARIKRVILLLSAMKSDEVPVIRSAILAAADASYIYTTTKPSSEPRTVQRLVVGVADVAASRAQYERGRATAAGVELAKEWANRPANHATPTLLAEAARGLAGEGGVDCNVLGPKEVAKLGMGALLAVSQGSEEPLRFIVLKYEGATKAAAPVVLVGKGITFDTGGISIKPAAEMDEMKFDMSGAASVLGVFRALAMLKPAVNVVGLIPACENMPDGRAIKPGDVVTSMSGKTVEILNTDAEGRLILCDALHYAERFKPRAVIDIATLTGACVIALGSVRSGMFSTNEDLAARLSAAGEKALDPCWRLPLDEEYGEGLKSNFADLANVAGRAAGVVTAAKFLQRFTAAYPWAHLDIAGTAWKGGAAKGATGRPVPLLLEYLLALADEPVADGASRRRTAKRA